MGGAACAEVILGGNLAYGVAERFKEKFPAINTFKLESATRASCEVVSYASLYFTMEGKDKLTANYTEPIQDLHNRIINELPSAGADSQNLINGLTNHLIEATRKILELFD